MSILWPAEQDRDGMPASRSLGLTLYIAAGANYQGKDSRTLNRSRSTFVEGAISPASPPTFLSEPAVEAAGPPILSGQQAEARAEQFAARVEALTALVTSGLTYTGLARLLVQWMLESTSARMGLLRILAPNGGQLCFEGIRHGDQWLISQQQLPSKTSSKRLPSLRLRVAPPASDANISSLSGEMPGERGGCEATLDWTLTHEQHSLGQVRLSGAFTAEQQGHMRATLSPLVECFAAMLRQRMLLEQAAELALRDELTGLHNRRYLHQTLEELLPRARSQRWPLSLFLLDVDHFKHFNDTWGHPAGDRVLQILGRLMKTVFRENDIVCRYGGEEFAVILCDRRASDAKDHPREVFQFAERLRQAAEQLELTSHDGQVLSQVTISGGIATFPWDAGSVEELVQMADRALYQAKRGGRNRVLLANADRAA